ncbi:trypsin-like peptidase domain-containing protein [Haloactinomyces albus]|uniref:Serine protease PepD n=1 Tax=Haloactinomyces albus TaxID=1352928 RepID=A0AAE3ZCZ9_9ACTN|nr:trypsin-like peptidase domain-containing protein [Haloactinomyces albus]MDR7301388.1 putative serine protease PepD [Haloactinomyces albus]
MTENTPGPSGDTPRDSDQQAESAPQQGTPGDMPSAGEYSQSTEQQPSAAAEQQSDLQATPEQHPAQYPHTAQQYPQGQPYASGSPYAQVHYGQQQYSPGQYGQEQPAQGPFPPGQYGQGWQQGQGGYPQPANATQTLPRSGRGGKGRLVAGVTTLALVAGLIGGGVGSFAWNQLGGSGSGNSAVTALDAPPPASNTSDAPAGSVQAVADKVLPSVVQIQVQTMQGQGSGSGIIISQDGYILTNNHVVQGGQQGRIAVRLNDRRVLSAEVVGTAPKSDLAVLKIDATGLNPAELGRSGNLEVGASVVAIGSPFGLSGTVTSGIISAKNRPVRAGGSQGSQSTVINALQTDAAINPGNSGGPLVNMNGRVVGINSAIYSPSSGRGSAGSVGLGFAIPIDHARRIGRQLIETGSAEQTTLGVRITPADGISGARVVKVDPGSPAEQGGVRAGDVITKVNNRVITSADELIAAIRSHAPGDRVTLTLTDGNGGNKRTTQVTLTGK